MAQRPDRDQRLAVLRRLVSEYEAEHGVISDDEIEGSNLHPLPVDERGLEPFGLPGDALPVRPEPRTPRSGTSEHIGHHEIDWDAVTTDPSPGMLTWSEASPGHQNTHQG